MRVTELFCVLVVILFVEEGVPLVVVVAVLVALCVADDVVVVVADVVSPLGAHPHNSASAHNSAKTETT